MKRFISLPNVTIDDDIIEYDYFQIDIKYIAHYHLIKNVFEITLVDDDEDDDDYYTLKSDWSKHPILCTLMEMKLLRLMNYWHKKDK